MNCLDNLVYNPERLACTGQEKEACLEMLRKLAQLSIEQRRQILQYVGPYAMRES